MSSSGRPQFGLVVDNCEHFSSDEEDEKDEGEEERLRQGFVRVAWHPKGEELVEKEKKVRAKNRFSYWKYVLSY